MEVCRAKLAKMGFPVDEQRVIISSHVAADYLNRNYAGKRVYLLGNERLTADLAAAGINLVEDEPDIVLLGFDTTLTYEKLRKAVNLSTAAQHILPPTPTSTARPRTAICPTPAR